jgi:SAM-dependent methyltransferase
VTLTTFSVEWQAWRARVDLDEYENRWNRLEFEGENVHGEADLIASLSPRSVLDAGCGMGRVGIELHRRDIDVVGVDLDSDLLDRARRNAPDITWHQADLVSLDLGRTFDVVAFAGNVIGFVEPARRHEAVAACAAHVAPGGSLLAGFSLRESWPDTKTYDIWCEQAGFAVEERWSSWDRRLFTTTSDYCVAIHRADATIPSSRR